MKIVKYCLFTLILCISQSSTRAQSKGWPLDTQRNTVVTLKIPKQLIGAPKLHVWKGNTSYSLSINTATGETVSVKGETDWQDAGWPLMIELRLVKVNSGKANTEVQLKAGERMDIYLKFAMAPELVNAAFHQVAFVGSPSQFEESPYYHKEVGDRLLPGLFAHGRLSYLSHQRLLNLMREVSYDAAAIQESDYKGQTYIGFTLEEDNVYNTLQLGQTARVARVVQDSLLKEFKGKYRVLAGLTGIDGIQLKMRIAYKDFTDTYAAEQHDELAVYTTLQVIKKFSDAEITSQQLLDESVVLVNGDRVQVSLNQAK